MTKWKNVRVTVAAVGAVAVIVSACSPSAVAPSAEAPSAAPPSAETPTAAPSEAATAETGVSDGALSVTFPWGEFKLAQRIVDRASAGQPMQIIVSLEGTAIPVFGAEQRIGTDRGCEAGKQRMSIECRLVGPIQRDITAQVGELETLLASGQVDCLVLHSGAGSDAFVDIANKFVDAGVPTFTENVDVPSSKRFAFYALNEQAAGRDAGVTTANLVKAQGLTIAKVAMGSGDPTGNWAQDRMLGFSEGYKSVFPDAVFEQDSKTGFPTGSGFTTQEVLDSVGPYLTGNSDVNLFFHTDQGVEGVGKVIADSDLTGKVWSSGFNVSLPILDSIDAGQILVTINQGFDNQAEAGVNACVDFLSEGKYPADPLAYLNAVIITKDGGEGQVDAATARENLKKVLAAQ